MFSLFGGATEPKPSETSSGSGSAALKAQVSMLRKQLKRTNADMETVVADRVKSATHKLNEQNTELARALQSSREEAGQARAAQRAAQDDLVSLHATTATTEAELRQRVEDARSEVDEMRSSLEHARARAEAAARRGASASNTGEVTALRAQLAAADANIAALSAARRKLESDLARAVEEATGLRSKASQASAEATSGRVRLRLLEEETRSLSAALERAEEDKGRCIAAVEAQRRELRLGREATARLSSIETMLRQARGEAAAARKEVVAAQRAAAEAKEQAAEALAGKARATRAKASALRTTRKSVAAIRSIRRASVAAGHGDPLSGLDARTRRRLTVCGVDGDNGAAPAAGADAAAESKTTGEGSAEDGYGSADGSDGDDAGFLSDESDVLDTDELDDVIGVTGPEEDGEGGLAPLSPTAGRVGSSAAAEGSEAPAAAEARAALAASHEALKDRLASALEAKEAALAAAEAARGELRARTARVEALETEVEEAAAARDAVAAEAAAAREELGRSQAARQSLVQDLIDAKGSLRVIARVRPIGVAGGGAEAGAAEAATVLGDDRVRVRSCQEEPGRAAGRDRVFGFHRAFGPSSTQEEVFGEVRPIVEGVMGGVSAVIFAYGQTGAGKTHTMQGRDGDEGVTPRAVRCILEGCDARRAEMGAGGGECEVSVGILEIYRETLRDLLTDTEGSDAARAPLAVRQEPGGRVFVEGLTFSPVRSADEAAGVMAAGLSRRAVSATAMNADSSRSHLVTLVRFSSTDGSTGVTTSASLFLVDLAGSERLKKSEAVGAQRSEAQAINKSLSALGDVLSALQARSAHVPFRNSRLTHLLMGALAPGGGCRATMIVQVSPAETNRQETTCSLAFGQRASAVELGKASRAVASSASGGSAGRGDASSSTAPSRRAEERLARVEASLKKERAARAQAEEELAVARRQARSLRTLVASRRGGGGRQGAGSGRARTLGASSASREDRTSVESTMEAAMDWLPASMPSQDDCGPAADAPSHGSDDGDSGGTLTAAMAPEDRDVAGFRPAAADAATPARAAPRSARKTGRAVPPRTPMRAPGSARRAAGRTKTPSRFGSDGTARTNGGAHAKTPAKTPTRRAALPATKTPSSMQRRIRAATSRIDTGRTPSRKRNTAAVPEAAAGPPPATPFRM